MAIPVIHVPGIGPKIAELLTQNGIETVTDLIQAGVDKLTQVPGISELKARSFIEAAKNLLGDAVTTSAETASSPAVTKVSQKENIQPQEASANKKDKKDKQDKEDEKDKKDKKKNKEGKKNKKKKKKKKNKNRERKKDRKKNKARNRKSRKKKK